MLLYGPPGNGKTTFAMRLAKVFNDMIYMPHAITVEGQIIRVYDPSLHFPVEPPGDEDGCFFEFCGQGWVRRALGALQETVRGGGR